MDEAKRVRLIAAGYRIGDAADFLGMDDDERAMLDFRHKLAVETKRLRLASGLSEASLADRAEATPPEIEAIEDGADGVGVDLILRAFFAAGGRVEVIPPR